MSKYNVLAAVVAIVEAADEESAKIELRHRLLAAGFDVYDGQPIDAFESEELPA